ncbi:MAG TPA: hypothetical protein VGA03_05385 [Anaerolineales bacterium]|jgi:hypothetical protein
MNQDRVTGRQAFWREWGPVLACALLSAAGLYLLAFTSTPFATYILFALALGCPLVVGLAWWLQRNKG